MKKRHKGLSIKARVTLWYTFFMILVFGITAVYLVSSSQRMSGRQMRERLVDTVTDAVSQVRFRYGELDAEELDFYKNGVSVFLYDTQGRLLAPKVTRGIQVDSLLEDQTIKTASSGRERWMIYDVYSEGEDAGFWVRGMISMTEYGQALGNLPILFGSALPLLAVLAALGGFRITRRAFRPVTQMAETARAIGTGSDLSQRIETDGRGDELNQLGDTMNEMLARLQASFEAERQFSSDVSHELRTPIAVIRSQCEFALSGQAGEEEKREAFEAVLKQSERMNSIVSQLLLLSRAENGKFVPEREPVELNVLCETVCEELEAMAAERQVELTWNTEELQITGDETLLIRMVNNLVSNAIRYNRPGGSAEVSLRKRGKYAVLTVRDTGIGIRREDLGQIFNRFYRADRSRSSEGTGLGLSMAAWIARVHGGSIRAESVYGEGSVFTAELPIEEQA
ncbi:HAMP domain-containing histidine kinase [Clostridiaceae bacterium Marseille-Q3526]|nr:HAMP domain-containing histidine kinase [Clostridiaceae bacterium Marseille-Q3526]